MRLSLSSLIFILLLDCGSANSAESRIDLICSAINNNKLIQINYNGGEQRLLEPHIYGLGNEGQVLLSAYQLGGPPTIDGEMIGWRSFNDEKIDQVSITDINFPGPRFDCNPDFTQFSAAFCKV